MGVLVPSVLVRTRAEAQEELALLSGLVDSVQIDVVDGTFASPATWPYAGGTNELEALKREGVDFHDWGAFKYEVDMMVARPVRAVGAFIALGAERVVAHTGDGDLLKLISDLEGTYGRDKDFAPDLLSLGLAIHIGADLDALAPYLPKADYVQFMGIARVGRQGAPFDSRVVPMIQEFARRHPGMPIQVDGGVSLETAPELLSAGATKLVVGSALWKSGDIPATVRAFDELAQTYGRYR